MVYLIYYEWIIVFVGEKAKKKEKKYIVHIYLFQVKLYGVKVFFL
jgi:hypothetical protein